MRCAIPDGRPAGGQYVVQLPVAVQVTLPPFSDSRTYRVRPSPLTRTVPSPATLATLTVTELFDALDLALVAGDPAAVAGGLVCAEDAVLLDEPHAANRMEAPATASIWMVRARCLLG